MKKEILAIIISVLVLGSLVIWITQSENNSGAIDTFTFVIIIIPVIFGLVFGINRIKSLQKGQPAEDELSKKIASKIIIGILLYFIVCMAADNVF